VIASFGGVELGRDHRNQQVEVIVMSDGLWDWILSQAGQPIACELCRAPTAPVASW
jgi:hypothetical protein